ncbi:GNAT family N-acetyltransferase [Cellulomonas soli]
MSGPLEVLPPRWRQDRFVLSEQALWGTPVVRGDDEALMLVATPGAGSVVRGLGAPERVGDLLDEVACDVAGKRGPVHPTRWLSVPRGTRTSSGTLASLRLTHVSEWDWLTTSTVPRRVAAESAVRRLDTTAEVAAVRDCLRAANPGTSADPAGPDEVAWWGVDDGTGEGVLAGVVGATARGGPGDAVTWHLHGLGVRPGLRGAGVGSALVAAATRAGLEAGAPWVSLGMYADNDGARRIYERLGYRTWARFTSFGPAGVQRPPD